jgi:hypothetical protein
VRRVLVDDELHRRSLVLVGLKRGDAILGGPSVSRSPI